MKHPYDNFFRKRLTMFKEAYRFRDKLIVALFLLLAPLGIDPKRKIIFKNKDGFFVARSNSDTWVSLEDYGLESAPFMEIKGGVFVNVGANIGKFVIRIGNRIKREGRVICFEPEEENFKILKENIKINKLDNILAIKKGCYSSNKKIDFYIHKASTRHSIIDKTNRKTTIEVVKLDDALKNEKDIRLIVIDAEGSDYRILKGAKQIIKKWHPIIIFEVSEEGLEEEIIREIESFFKKERYNLIKITSNYLAMPPEKKLTKRQKKHLEDVRLMYEKSKRWKY